MPDSARELTDATLLDAIVSTQALYVRGRSAREVFDHLLQTLLRVTDSGYGFVGEVEHDADGRPRLRTHAITNIAWNAETRAFHARYEAEGLVFSNLETLFGRVLTSGEGLISNDPAHDPRRGGLPPGHPAMHCFLGLPAKAGEVMVGMIGLANRPGGYDEALVRQLAPLVSTCAQIIQAFQLDRERQRALDDALDLGGRLQAMVATTLAAQQAVEQGAAELAAVLELSPEGYVVFGADGRCRRINAAGTSLTGLAPESVHGLEPAEVDRRLVEATGLSGRWPGLDRLVDGDHGELQFARPRPALVQYAHRVLPGPADTPLGRALQLRDVTRQTELDRMKSEFLATAAHELRTPLAAIHGFTELMLAREFDEVTRLDLLATMQRESSRMVAMLGDLLDLARIEARRGADFEIRPQPLAPILTEALVGFPPAGSAQRLEYAGCPPGLTLPVDSAKLVQALRNLLSNAGKYSPPEASIRLAVLDADPVAVGIEVSDPGVGIPAHLHERVFERFFRVDGRGGVPGTGLGLALVREIVTLHGGHVTLDSAPGRGTTVSVWLPRLPPDA